METFLQDLRYGARALFRNPAFAAVAMLSLALGIGANAAIFTMANSLLFKPMAVPAGERLIRASYGTHSPFAFPDYSDIRDRVKPVVDLAALRSAPVMIGEGDGSHDALAELITPNYLDVIGVRLSAGRPFTNDEARIGDHNAVAILSDRLWRRDFAARQDMLGKTVSINAERYVVVGIAPASYRGGMFGHDPDVLLPINEATRLAGMDLVTRSRGGGLYTVGRLREGAGIEQARAAMSAAAAQLANDFPQIHRDMRISVDRARGVPAEAWPALAVIGAGLQVLVGLVLLIACSNVVNVVLARMASRQREIALRAALGANRSRLIRQLTTECVFIAAGAASIGLVFGSWAVQLSARMLPADFPLSTPDLSVDARVVLYTGIVALVVLLVCGLWPALRTSQPMFAQMLREGSSGADRRQSRMRNTLLAAQVAMCTVLLVGCGLFLRSLWSARDMRTGFDAARVLDVPIDTRALNLDETRGRALIAAIRDRVSALRGVSGVSSAQIVPLSFDNMGLSFEIEAAVSGAPKQRAEAGFNVVDTDYFKTLGIGLVAGRDFARTDATGSPFVVVVNETMAQLYWPGQSALGKRFGADVWGSPAEVVGVVRDSKYTTLAESNKPFMYLPYAQHYSTHVVLHVRTNANPRELMGAVTEQLRALAPAASVRSMRPLSDDISTALLPAKIGAALLGAFGGLALVLAMGGVFGVISFAVAQRTREIGIRSALGGRSADIMRFVLSGSTRWIGAGVAVGLLLSVGMGQLLSSFLYGVTAVDPVIFTAVPVVLFIVSLAASVVPVRRAIKVDPLVALRAD